MKLRRKILALLLVCLMIVALVACNKDNGGTSSPVGSDNSNNSSNSDNNVSSDNSGNNNSNNSGGNSGANSGGNSGGNSSGGAGTADPGRRLNVQVAQDSGSLFRSTSGMGVALGAFYEPLLDVRGDGEVLWVLSTGIDYESDIHGTMHIREGVTFSNGNPLTADDVMFTMWRCFNDPQFALNVKAIDFEKTKVIDDYTIDLWYTEFNSGQITGFAQMSILDEESFDEVELSLHPNGTGPYELVEYVINSHIDVTARDGYWGDPPSIKNIRFSIINEDSQIINALETGELDIANIPITELDFVRSLGYRTETYGNGYYDAILFSLEPGNPLESKEARYAVCHAVNRQAIANILFQGMSTVLDYPVSHYLLDCEPRFLNMHETYSIGYDPVRARELAEQSGLVGKSIRIVTNGTAAFDTIAEMVQYDLQEIGVDAEIIRYDQASYFSIMADATNFEIVVLNPVAPSRLACDILAMYFTFIPLSWTGPDFDRYSENARGALTTYDEAKRSEMLYEALKIFVDYTPWYGICEAVNVRAVSNELNPIVEYLGSSYMVETLSFK